MANAGSRCASSGCRWQQCCCWQKKTRKVLGSRPVHGLLRHTRHTQMHLSAECLWLLRRCKFQAALLLPFIYVRGVPGRCCADDCGCDALCRWYGQLLYSRSGFVALEQPGEQQSENSHLPGGLHVGRGYAYQHGHFLVTALLLPMLCEPCFHTVQLFCSLDHPFVVWLSWLRNCPK